MRRPSRSKAAAKTAVGLALRVTLRIPPLRATIERIACYGGRHARSAWWSRALIYHVRQELLRFDGDRIRFARLPGGTRLAVNLKEGVWQMLYFNGVYEPESTAFVRQFLRSGDVFLDVGANAGYYTMMAASIVGEQGRVHAFEPNPDVAALLRASVYDGKFTERVAIAATALGARAGSATLYLPHEAWNTGEASLFHTAWTSRERTLTVPLTTLDDYCERNGVPRIRLIKMDVEGAELEVLEGARSVLKNLRPEALLCEFVPARRPEAQVQVLELLSGCGYRSFIVNHDGSLRPHEGSLPNWEWGNLCFLASDK